MVSTSAAMKYLQLSLMPTQRLKEYPEIKILNFPDGTTIFLLRDINSHYRIQSILNHMKKLPAQKHFFQKFWPYNLWHIQIELRNQDKWYGHNSILKYLECILLIPSLVTTTGDIINNK